MPNLPQYKILLADPDQHLAQVLKSMLGDMGFSDVQATRNGGEALELLSATPFDFLITEWNLKHLDGINLIQRLRRDVTSPRPTLPIIMLTGRAEQADVVAARDSGINEYVVKPFSAKTIYNRIERIVEHPRNFVVTQQFIGPDRRHKGTPPPGVPDRRTRHVIPQTQPLDIAGEVANAGAVPKVWLPDYALKRKLGENIALPQIITPAVLNLAQATIDAITGDSLQWIKENLSELKALYAAMMQGNHSRALAGELGELALTIRGRTGTFGYARASEVAYMLYLFCRNHLRPERAIHRVIVEKHIEVLQVMLGNDVRGTTSPEGAQIFTELRKLAEKYAA